ncbi:hypothetical protein [Desulfosporosinus sp. FKB]|uniref:hypothetical protein n=1 Tax=Desulfosporosinus sp. FKB TaxID=1969835 RepID=UPI000B499609|nr:hypothetical protein [Desulfosporosinus sp. FKB]
MIFLGNFNKISDTQWAVGFQHNMPLDPIEGMKDENGNLYTQDQLNQMGILVDSMPAQQPPQGQILSCTYINPQTKDVSYSYQTPINTDPNQLITQLQSDLAAANKSIGELTIMMSTLLTPTTT